MRLQTIRIMLAFHPAKLPEWGRFGNNLATALAISRQRHSNENCKGGDVTALNPRTLNVTATCFQYHDYGRRTGLKIRSSQEGVGSSPTFGTDCKMLNSVARSD